MIEPITNTLNQEIDRIFSAFISSLQKEDRQPRHFDVESIFRESAVIRSEANSALRHYSGRMSMDDLIEFQSILNAKLDELLLSKISLLFEQQALAWANNIESDPVTSLPNRAAFNRRISGEIERARRYHRELSVILFDIDRFKLINDRFGHPAGDSALSEVAKLLKSSLRQSDAVFRYGGDEFAAICPETSGSTMAHALSRLQSKLPTMLKESGLQWRHNISLDISWGSAAFPEDAVEENELIRIADDRLYACKRSHRRYD